MKQHFRANFKKPERGCVVLGQPQQVLIFTTVSIFDWLGVFPPGGGWSATQPRSIFRALNQLVRMKRVAK